jgi:hypothetical protein
METSGHDPFKVPGRAEIGHKNIWDQGKNWTWDLQNIIQA